MAVEKTSQRAGLLRFKGLDPSKPPHRAGWDHRDVATTPQQCLRLLEIRRIEPFREPVEDLGQLAVNVGPPALLPRQSGKAYRGAQLQRSLLLPPGNLDRSEKARLGRGLSGARRES